MNIKPVDFLEAKTSVDYLSKVLGVDFDDEMYTFHIYNLAAQLSLVSNRPSDTIDILAKKDGFIETMKDFEDRYWEIIQTS